MSEPIPESVHERAELLVTSGLAGDRFLRDKGQIGQPIEVQGPGGARHSWFVPVTVGERLAGFLQLLPDLAFLRYSSFQRREGELEGCPEARLWLDREAIRATAREEACAEEELGEPVLSFDGSPERIAWAVPARAPGGEERTIFVAGATAWTRETGGAGLY